MSSRCTSPQAERRPGSSDWTKEFDRILREASENVQTEWFKLPVSGGDAVYRERVYCYELYHQMRCRWPPASACFLSGEVDKGGHSYFRSDAPNRSGAPNPDFLVHAPGDSRNYAVIEVKSCEGARKKKGIKKDIKTLIQFTKDIERPYDRAIFLIFGEEMEGVEDRVRHRLQKRGQRADKIEVWFHSCAGTPAVCIGLTVSGSGLSG